MCGVLQRMHTGGALALLGILGVLGGMGQPRKASLSQPNLVTFK